MTIEPVLEIFGEYNATAIARMRQVVFEEFAKSDSYGMIFTYMWAFDSPSDWEYIASVRKIFEPYGTDFYYVELVADKATRLQRNRTENRLLHKASKRDLAASDRRLDNADERYRLESFDGEIPYENYIKINNTNLSPEEVADIIKKRFKI